MAGYARLEVTQEILNSGLLPLFYHADSEVACKIASACLEGGAHVIEFTNRGEYAMPVFSDLVKYFRGSNTKCILGAGSVVDAPTAALFIAAGANFIVGPSFNPEISRLCNRRKILYLPGCATENEISSAEEMGAEICKIFPAESAGGVDFIKSVMAPCPWHRLLPTGGVDATEESITQWIQAGAAAVGMGGKLIPSKLIQEEKFSEITAMTSQCLSWIKLARHTPLFLGLEHIGLYHLASNPDQLSAWYADLFDFSRKEGATSFFVHGQGAGRIEFPKVSLGVPLHLAIRVSNFELAVEALRQKGAAVKDINIQQSFKAAFLENPDPEGNLIHLLWLAD